MNKEYWQVKQHWDDKVIQHEGWQRNKVGDYNIHNLQAHAKELQIAKAKATNKCAILKFSKGDQQVDKHCHQVENSKNSIMHTTSCENMKFQGRKCFT